MAETVLLEEDQEYLIWGSTLKAIGNAIREKTGGTANLSPADMPAEIRGITGGGSDVAVVYVTFMSHDGATELYRRAVVPGNDCMEIVSGGLINTPTRASSAQYNYTFAGWATTVNGGLNANALKNVTQDRTVYANYVATTRYYTVRFFDGETLISTQSVAYGANAAAPQVTKEGYQLDGWQPSNLNITADTDCYAQWIAGSYFSRATWAEIAAISEAGEAADYFAVGDTKEITWGGYTYKLAVLGINHDDLADGSGKAGLTIGFITAPPATVQASSTVGYNNFWYNYCSLRNTIVGFQSEADLADIVAVAKSVTKESSYFASAGPGKQESHVFFAYGYTEVTGGKLLDYSDGTQYAYFANADKRKICAVTDTTAPVEWWTRFSMNEGTASSTYQDGWVYIDSNGVGQTERGNQNQYKYAPFAFCV